MTRSQALTIGALSGLVLLLCLAIVMLLILPYQRLLPAPPTATLPAPSPTWTSTLPSFLPTAGLVTPTLAEPTPTNTRVPTVTPQPPRPPTPTVIINLTLPPRSTPTPTPLPPPPPPPTLTPTASPTAIIARQYNISFSAKDSSVEKGKCTDLRWQVEGAASVALDGQTVAASGKKKVCPTKETDYRLTVQLPDNSPAVHRTVTIKIKKEENN